MKRVKWIGIMMCIVVLSGCVSFPTSKDNNTTTSTTKHSDAEKVNGKSIIDFGQAKKIAIDDVPGNIVYTHKEYEDGGVIYEIHIVKDYVKYEFEIDGDGNIISKEEEAVDYTNHGSTNSKNNHSDYGDVALSMDEARAIFLAKCPEGVVVTKSKMDDSHGEVYYKFEAEKNDIEYEGKINANTGEIIKFEIDD